MIRPLGSYDLRSIFSGFLARSGFWAIKALRDSVKTVIGRRAYNCTVLSSIESDESLTIHDEVDLDRSIISQSINNLDYVKNTVFRHHCTACNPTLRITIIHRLRSLVSHL